MLFFYVYVFILFIYGNIFLNTFIIEVKNPEIFIENALLPDEYLMAHEFN